MQKTTSNSQMDAAKEAVKKQLLQALMQQVVTELSQKTPDELADMSREVVQGIDLEPVRERIASGARLHLEARMAELEPEIDTADIEDRVRKTAEVRIADHLQKAVEPHLNIKDDQVNEAVDRVEKQVHETVARMVAKRLDDTTRVVDQVLPAFDTDNEQILKAVEATRERLVGRVADQVVSRLQEPDEIAAMASSRISAEDEAIQNAVLRSMELILDDVIQLAEKRIQSSQTLATDARNRMMKVIPEVEQAADALEKLLIKEAASTAAGRLSNVETTSQAARAEIEDESAIFRASEALNRQLTVEIANNALRRVSDVEAAGKAARKLIPDDHEAIERAQTRLRERLVDEIAQRAVDAMRDSQMMANESFRQIDLEMKQIADARTRVHSMVIDQIVQHTVQVLSDTETTAFSVVAQVDSRHEVMQRIGDVVRRRLFESLLSTALADLGSKVSNPTEEGEQALFREALKSLAGGGRVSTAAASSTMTPKPEAASPAFGPSFDPDSAPGAPPTQASDESGSVGWTRLSDIRRSDAEPPEPIVDGGTETSERSWKVSEFKPGEVTESEEVTPTDVIYVYGIMDASTAHQAEFGGIPSIEVGKPVEIIDCGDLFVVASRVSSSTYGRNMLKEHMKDTEWVREQVRQHAGVLSDVRSAGTVVPLRFGIVFETIDSVDEYVNARSAHYRDALSRLHDRSEFGVRMHCQYDDLRGALSSPTAYESPIMQDVFDAFESMGTDGSEDEAFRLVLDTCIRRSHTMLEAQADESVVKQYDDAPGASTSGTPLNATYLVASGAEPGFQDAVRTVAEELQHFGITFEVSGPWPPYHFVDVDPRRKGRSSMMIPA